MKNVIAILVLVGCGGIYDGEHGPWPAADYAEAWVDWMCSGGCLDDEAVCYDAYMAEVNEVIDDLCVDAEIASACLDTMDDHGSPSGCFDSLPECHWRAISVSCS